MRGPSLRRILTVCLALVANLFAAGAPLLHGAAHESHDGHPHELVAAVELEADHGHDEVHPASLHDDCTPLRRLAPDFLFLPSATPVAIDAAAERHAPPPHLVSTLRTRAPPPGDPARAPPLA